MDGRRHSVDVPISKTLVALRRVRSLRDPSTNSMSKLCSSIDNLHWENSSGNGISLRFLDASRACDSDDNGALRSKNLSCSMRREHDAADFELNCGHFNSKLKSCPEGQQDEELAYSNLNQEVNSGIKSTSDGCYSNHRRKELDIASVIPPSNEATSGSSKLGTIDHSMLTRKTLGKNQVKSSEVLGDIAGLGGSPCLSVGEAFSAYSSSTNMNQDVDIGDDNHHGCGISCCWSKSPRFRESNVYSDIEDRPLISWHTDETALYGHKNMRHIGGEISPNFETPRSLCMKFRPKSFSDLVGQNVVARSLLGAIFKGRVTSFYLFHGPRGTGKTSASRIFAAALNCLSLEEERPCGLCRECVLFFSGRSKDVKEVDSVKLNRIDKIKSLVKNASIPPVSSRFKIFIVDECQLITGEAWASLLNSLESLSQHVVLIMITPDLDKLPRSTVSRAQRYHFPKIKDADIASRLEKICIEEGLDFEQEALGFISAKSCGSLRDAEIMLDQLSLLGKKITISLAHELTGIISDDELLELLDLALSSDTSNTVKRARELMRSRVDPLQLISQLANLIMDILAGKCDDSGSEIRMRFSNRRKSEADLQKLNHALRILSETEKQLRISKNQTTWFTVALLQLSSAEHSSVEASDTKLRYACNGDGDFCSTSSTGDSRKHPASAQYDNKLFRLGQQDHALSSIWHKATESCQSNRLKTFLRKQGKLSSLCVDRGLAIAELDFQHRNYVYRAEKSWKMIASSLQLILGCNIELRINHVPCTSDSTYAKLKRSSFSFFTCSRRIHRKALSDNEQGSEPDYTDHTSQKAMMKDRTCKSDCGSQMQQPDSYHGMEVVTALRDGEGNLLSSRKNLLNSSCQETSRTSSSGVDSSKEEGFDYAHLVSSNPDSDYQSKCFPRTFWIHKKKLHSPDLSQLVFEGTQQQKEFVLSIPNYTCSETYSYASEPCVFSTSSNNCTKAAQNEKSPKLDSDLLCWRTPRSPLRKSWHVGLQQHKSHPAGRFLSCASAK
ncbi:protein STICHEL-like 2 isoform X1 [Neltuma alba]|uniref:protein STICHEL-like 2 isoform X1 n=1 Tax=Neltuma alba TaxID=207710 RepID=UPI0010A45818|nr:protein STICHEL-like 2 isoform X1 [Prosopis alba]